MADGSNKILLVLLIFAEEIFAKILLGGISSADLEKVAKIRPRRDVVLHGSCNFVGIFVRVYYQKLLRLELPHYFYYYMASSLSGQDEAKPAL